MSVQHQRDLATDQRADARRIVEEARLEAAALLHMERQHGGHGRDGHLNEDDPAPLLTALQITPADPATAAQAPTWEDDLTERLAGVVADMLSRFGGQGPNSQHSGWVSERTLTAWRSVYREWADQVAPEGREADSD